jgi:hypothetical protein
LVSYARIGGAGARASGKATDFQSVAQRPSRLSLPDDGEMESVQTQVATTVDWLFAPDWLSIEEACFLSDWDRDAMLEIIDEDNVDLDDDGRIEKQSLYEFQECLALVLHWDD